MKFVSPCGTSAAQSLEVLCAFKGLNFKVLWEEVEKGKSLQTDVGQSEKLTWPSSTGERKMAGSSEMFVCKKCCFILQRKKNYRPTDPKFEKDVTGNMLFFRPDNIED
jgi:hypothetical protein